MKPQNDTLINQVFARLTVISKENDGKHLCRCECGNIVKVRTKHLKSGNTKSCGCLNIEVASQKSDKLIEGRRKFEPRIASARRVWKNTYWYRDTDCVGFEEFLIISQQNCFYCGVLPSTKYNQFLIKSARGSKKAKHEGAFVYNGIDRIDSSKPHITENIVACCYDCNRAKNDRSTQEFFAWTKRLTTPTFYPITIPNLRWPTNRYLATSIRCVFYNHKNDTDLTVEEYFSVSQMNCFYCGGIPGNIFNKAKTDKKSSEKAKIEGNYIYNGIDRIDRSLPHNKNNIVPCCYWCNFAKGKMTLPDFYGWILRVQSFQRTQEY